MSFSVFDRVRVSIPEIPRDETNCKEGVIVGIQTRFARTPALRRVTYKVRFDNAVIKPEHVRFKQIFELSVDAAALTRLT